jgi:protein-disulfide isomerase
VNRNRLLLLGGVIGVAALAAVVLIVVVSGGDSKSSTPATSPGATTTSSPSSSLAGIPQHGATLGNQNAPSTLVVYEDPQCPFCRQWNIDTLPTVVRDFVRTGKVKLEYRGIVIIGPNSVKGLRATYAAAPQNKLWNMVDALYAHQGAENSGWITNDVIRTAARDAGADSAQILAHMSSPGVTAELTRVAKQSDADQVRGTPTFIVEHPPALSQQLALTSLEPAAFVASLTTALQQ